MARILVLDRTSSVREALALVLELEGHMVEQAPTGREALDRLAATGFDVILADIHLRDIAFAEFCLSVRSLAPNARLVTMSMDRADSDRFEPCTPAAFLAKPFPTPTLLAAVEATPTAAIC